MAFEEGNGTGTTMLVQPSGFGGNGMFGGDGWWIILLLLCGWGNGGFGGMNGGYDFPWILNGQNGINNNTNAGFRDAMLNDGINSIGDKVSSGFGDVSTALCGGFAGVNATVNSAANGITNRLYDDTIASLERSFALQSQLSQCCCDNRLATCQTQNLIGTESAATRLAIQEQTQAILDKMCQQEIDAYKRENENLRSMLNMQTLAASQTAQTRELIADNTAQTQYIVNRVAPYPIPSYTVPNPFTPATAG